MFMMKKLIALMLIAMPLMVLAQSNPFRKIKYDRVVAYEFQGEGGRTIDYCLKRDSIRIHKSKVLTVQQVSQFEKIITATSSYGKSTASCFDPHLAVVYYLKKEIVATVDVCLDCNHLSSSANIPATSSKKVQITEDVAYPAHGFSKEARKSLYKFCKTLGFEQYLRPLVSVFDE